MKPLKKENHMGSLGTLLVSEQKKLVAWSKASIIPGYEIAEWRRDQYGSVMQYSEYGNTSSEYGWEIDHILPSALGGGDQFENLQALHWKNNRSKGASLL